MHTLLYIYTTQKHKIQQGYGLTQMKTKYDLYFVFSDLKIPLRVNHRQTLQMFTNCLTVFQVDIQTKRSRVFQINHSSTFYRFFFKGVLFLPKAIFQLFVNYFILFYVMTFHGCIRQNSFTIMNSVCFYNAVCNLSCWK